MLFRLKMWTMGYTWTMGLAVAYMLFQVVTDLAFHFVDLLDLEWRQEFFVFSIVFLANVEDLLAAFKALLDSLLSFLVVGGLFFWLWS